jgi:cytochrome c551/c552
MRSYISATRVPREMSFGGDPTRGEGLFAEKGCVHCHSYRGVGGTEGPDFADVALDYSAVQIAGKMWNHAPRMWEIMEKENITVPEFKEGEMADLVAYLYSLKLHDEPGNADRGRRLIDNKGCLACHPLRGEGPKISKDLASLEGMDSSLAMIAGMWNHAPGMQEKHKEKHKKWPKLGARDMADLYAYLYQVTHESGGGE